MQINYSINRIIIFSIRYLTIGTSYMIRRKPRSYQKDASFQVKEGEWVDERMGFSSRFPMSLLYV